MPFQQNKLNDRDLDKMFKALLDGLEENAGLDVKRKIVNSILPVHKYKVLHRFLSQEEGLSEENRLNCLSIFLDENTKYFNFVQSIFNQTTIKNILEIIPRYCPNIETVDFRRLFIEIENKENFETFLKKTTSLKSLRVKCDSYINQHDFSYQSTFLLKEDFDLYDKDVQIGLLKIDYISGDDLTTSECEKLLNLLPNLKSLGICQPLEPLVSSISDDNELVKKLFNLIEIGDHFTSPSTLERLIKFCPKTRKINLFQPLQNVIKNLRKFPLLTEIQIYSQDPDNYGEIINLLKKIGKQITILILFIPVQFELYRNIFHELCPELIKLQINLRNE